MASGWVPVSQKENTSNLTNGFLAIVYSHISFFVQEILDQTPEGELVLGDKTLNLHLHNDYSSLFLSLRIDEGYAAIVTNPLTSRQQYSSISR